MVNEEEMKVFILGVESGLSSSKKDHSRWRRMDLLKECLEIA